jgi:hypothetical protein
MALNTSAITTSAGSPEYSINSLIQQTQPSAFRRVLGGVVGGVGNLFAPGLGSMLGGAIAGNATGVTGAMSSDSTYYLQLQQQMEAESRAFQAASNVLKSRHDAAMASIQNIR